MTQRVVFLDRASLKAKVRKPSCATEYVEHEKTAVSEIVVCSLVRGKLS
jgi:glycerate dehydrogenase